MVHRQSDGAVPVLLPALSDSSGHLSAHVSPTAIEDEAMRNALCAKHLLEM